jgi:CheY-like chemotaxis protein
MATKNCLLIEDRVEDALLVKRHLAAADEISLNWVMDGEEAVRYLERQTGFSDAVTPDLILLDLKLPGMDGFSFLEWCRNNGPSPKTPVMVLTVSSMPEDMRRAEKLGVRTYLTKPINWKRFGEEIADFTDPGGVARRGEGMGSRVLSARKRRRVTGVLTFLNGKKVTVKATADFEGQEVPFKYDGDTSLFRPFAPSGTLGFLKWYLEGIAVNAGAQAEFFEEAG